ncbi:malonyl-CoA decarboxylase [Mangrovicoccus algicola]|uniref:Malonyl-CoA decarboxylase n=1 Tax=Mangrovicoccus algicola TaxID=2771008 RepID=A0A8J6YYN9_9RHOB|nr:malonyl-CoA decarboxylase [Mangrovicoccus algicola]
MTILADLLSTVFERRGRGPAAKPDGRSLPELAAALMGASAETEGLSLARQILDRYEFLDEAGRAAFFAHLAGQMDIDPQAVRASLDAYEDGRGAGAYRAFLAAAEPPRQELIRRLNQVPGATHRLVEMRADLLRLARKRPELGALDQDLRHLFRSWFNRGFLVSRPITWDSPASVLEKIIAYEAVHAIQSWDDLRLRLAPSDRRCFAFFHPAMPEEPLIFVEVALTRGIPGSIQALLDDDRAAQSAAEADTAVFYSISNCQEGLAGISFGNFLIKQVAADLAAALPGLKTFVTLSPIPGLMRWIAAEGLEADPADAEAMRILAARYLLGARREDGKPADPVARFHLGNGALVHAVHGGADISANGMAQSGGAMVNYLYDLARVTPNHEAYAQRGEIAATPAVRALAARPPHQDTTSRAREKTDG